MGISLLQIDRRMHHHTPHHQGNQCICIRVHRDNECNSYRGLEEFHNNELLHEIVIANIIKVIKEGAFKGCSELIDRILGEGLEEIRGEAFEWCTLLHRTVIPPAVMEIDDSTFKGCSNLMNVEFCDMIESVCVLRGNVGLVVSGSSYNGPGYLLYFSEMKHSGSLGSCSSKVWANIYEMLKCIPSIYHVGLNAYFEYIDSKLPYHENLVEAARLMELVIPNNVPILHVLSYLRVMVILARMR